MKHQPRLRPAKSTGQLPLGPVSKVTTKGQVTIPKRVRDHLGVKAGSSVEFDLNAAGELVIRKVGKQKPSRFAALRGSAGPGMTTDEIMALTRGEDWKASS